MSWSVMRSGTKQEVLGAIAADFDAAAKNYDTSPGNDSYDDVRREEYLDVIAAKDRTIAMVRLVTDAPDGAISDPGVRVYAYGSRSAGDTNYGGSFTVNVDRVSLAELTKR